MQLTGYLCIYNNGPGQSSGCQIRRRVWRGARRKDRAGRHQQQPAVIARNQGDVVVACLLLIINAVCLLQLRETSFREGGNDVIIFLYGQSAMQVCNC